MNMDGDAAENNQAAPEAHAAEASDQGENNPEEQSPALALEERLRELEAEISDLTDQLLRKSADFENYRKRMHRDKEDTKAQANRDLLLDLLPIVDDFERAIKSSEESRDFDAFHGGVAMIEKQFVSMLERKWKLTRFDSVGEEFDPQRHEAMMTEERSDHEQSMVLEDYQKGYLLNDKVLRPAKVKVSVPVAPAQASSEQTDAEQSNENTDGSGAAGDQQ
jgi:molecular chaperone GrpE